MWSLGCILYQLVYKQSPWEDLPLQQKLIAITQDSFAIPFPSISFFFLPHSYAISNPWLLDVLHLCLQRDPLRRPPIDGPNGLLQHPFLQPQCVRAMQLYKEMTMKSVTMHETVRQIHALSKDERWKMEGIVPMVTKVGVELDSDD